LLLNIVEKSLFCTSQVSGAPEFVREMATFIFFQCQVFLRNVVYQKLKLVDFSWSYTKKG